MQSHHMGNKQFKSHTNLIFSYCEPGMDGGSHDSNSALNQISEIRGTSTSVALDGLYV